MTPTWAAVAVLAAVALLAVARTAWLCDDAFITLRVVDNTLHGYGPRWNVAERVQVFTHPLWFLALDLAVALTREVVLTTVALGLACTAGVFVLVARVAPEPVVAAAAILTLAASPSFVDYATSGLENPLTHVLLLTLAWLWIAEPVDAAAPVQRRRAQAERRVVAIAATFSGLVLNRVDLGALAVVPLVLAAWELPRAARARALALGCAPLAAWFGFSLVYYGAWLPNTAAAKLSHGIARDEVLAQGLVYLARQLDHDPLSVGVIVAGVVVPLWRRDLRALALGVGGWLYVAYVVKVGGDFMLGRFFTAPFVAGLAALLVAARSGARTHPPREHAAAPARWPTLPGAREAWPAAAAGAVALAIAAPRGPWATSDARLRPEGASLIRAGISDERAYYFPGTAIVRLERAERWPLHGFGAAGARLAKLAEARDRVVIAGEVGMRGYFSGPTVHIVDPLALTDPLLARLPARTDQGWRIGHFARHVPLGYLEWLRGDQPALADPALAALHEQVVLVTRGALWSPARWRAIVALQRGIPQRAAVAGRAAFFRDPIHFDVPAWAVLEPKPAGYGFHGQGVIQISRARGTRVHFDALQRSRGLELSLDHNDAYRVTFERGGRAVAQPVVIEPRKHARSGLDVRSIQVPPAAVRDGYDTVWIEGIKRTDRLFAVGHVQPVASAPAQDGRAQGGQAQGGQAQD